MEKINITIIETSNPSILKFEANQFLTNYQSFEFHNIDEAKDSPLAQQLFHLPFVKKVYIAGNFIAIEKYNIVEWIDIQEEVKEQIENYINSGEIIVKTASKKVAFTVYAEITPNPSVVKFVSNKKLVTNSFEFTSIDEAKESLLATELFHFPFVKNVFIDENYVSVTKYDIAEWQDITLELREFIKSFLESGKEVITASAAKKHQKTDPQIQEQFDALDTTSKEIVNILEEYIKPAVANDGGNIQFHSYDPNSKKVKVILQGACSGCPSSTITLKNGIETMLKQMLNGRVESVEAING